MTDCSPRILSWWKTNECLKEFIDGGYLDIALFDVYSPSDLACVYSGRVLSPNSLRIPPFVILNSVLSCLKQDVLSVRPTGFAPAVISLFSSHYEYFPTDPIILRNLQFPLFHLPLIPSDSAGASRGNSTPPTTSATTGFPRICSPATTPTSRARCWWCR